MDKSKSVLLTSVWVDTKNILQIKRWAIEKKIWDGKYLSDLIDILIRILAINCGQKVSFKESLIWIQKNDPELRDMITSSSGSCELFEKITLTTEFEDLRDSGLPEHLFGKKVSNDS